MQTVYVEKDILSHPRVIRIIKRLQPKHIVQCENYKEIFNPKAQNFRVQKQNPSLILAKKLGKTVFLSPPGFGIGGQENYYFSHMLNCLYDCRYCFLQGMYSSAHYVVFINYEDMMTEIKQITESIDSPVYFFSGYDGDSLAFEPVTHFVQDFLPFWGTLKENAYLELRTKSTNIKCLLATSAVKNMIVAFSFTPTDISEQVEHKVPSVLKRIEAMSQVAAQGWSIGIRLDPLIFHPNFVELYRQLLFDIFTKIPTQMIHSVSVGQLRFPLKMYQTLIKLYPHDALLTQPLYRFDQQVSYKKSVEKSMKKVIYELLADYVERTILFECQA